MNLSFSNIAWLADQDENMNAYLQSQGFMGLEIAPTRIFPDNPYERINEAHIFAEDLHKRYGLVVSSMQSIWYGRIEKVFGSANERQTLIEYTKKAVDFAAAIGCGNLVFGCPKNRNMPKDADVQVAYDFFSEIAEYAVKCSTVIALEPNPPIYGTNFINRTTEAFAFAEKIDGLKVNIDFGTIIENGEDLQIIADNLGLVNHIHVSEPNLAKIEERSLHSDLACILRNGGYSKFVSIEMKNLGDIEMVKQTAENVRRIFS
jgi:sugar phosphate isomerase/epimerase